MPAAELYQKYASHYLRAGNREPDWRLAEEHPERFARHAEWLPADRSVRILDVGCGWGNLLLSLWSAGYRRLEGIDLSFEQAEIGHAAAEGRAAIQCSEGAPFLASHESSYDLITLMSVLEHIPPGEVVGFLQLVRRALAPGGRVVIYVPNMANLTSAWIQSSDLTHRTSFTELSLQQALEQAGFEDHSFVKNSGRDLSAWRIWRPWRGLGLGVLVNNLIHRTAYRITGQSPIPTRFEANLEVYSHRPAVNA
jgi:2-polyprenyl-3-methyl-5-hydroxy-6-metoxy-1,4-benzoquinol methylase